MTDNDKRPRTLIPALLMVVLALASAVGLLVMHGEDVATKKSVYGLLPLALVGTLAVAAFGAAIYFVIARKLYERGPGFGAYHHVVRVGVVLVVLVAGGLIARTMLVPETFGDFGHFRGAALEELANIREPLHQGAKVCQECHDDVFALHEKDVHKTVQCENCHGPAKRHVAFMRGEAPDDGTTQIEMPKTKELCLTCHRRLAARPTNFPQIQPEEHFDMVEVNEPSTPCFSCHSPHEPLFLDTKLADARRHPRIQRCRDCHDAGIDETAELPEHHQAVFRCDYCHTQLAKDFSKRPHSYLGCGVCHQYYSETEMAGRIVKHRDPRFCLLCHQDRPFVKAERKPVIAWPGHLEKVAPGPENAGKVCVDCHREAFHMPYSTQSTPAAGGVKP